MTTTPPTDATPDLSTELLALARATAEEAALLVGAGRASAADEVDTKSSSVDVVTADGNEVVIASGLTPGMLVVAAGVHVLTPGQKVTA